MEKTFDGFVVRYLTQDRDVLNPSEKSSLNTVLIHLLDGGPEWEDNALPYLRRIYLSGSWTFR